MDGSRPYQEVVETFIVDWPALVLLGLVFGSFAPEDRWASSRAFYAGLVASGTFTLVAFLSYLVAPDWMWMYFVDPGAATWVVPLLAPAYMAVFVLSFAAASGFRQLGKRALWPAISFAAIANVVVLAATWDRYRFVGSAREWAEGRAPSLATLSPAGDARTVASLALVFVIVGAASFWIVWKDRRAPAVRR